MRRRSSSLFEIIISASIFAIAALAAIQLSLTIQRANSFSVEQAVAAEAAAEKIEELKTVPFEDLLALDGSTFVVERLLDNKRIELKAEGENAAKGAGRVSIVPVGNGRFLRIQVDIKWRSTGGSGSYSLTWGTTL